MWAIGTEDTQDTPAAGKGEEMSDLTIEQILILDRADKRGHILLGDDDICPGIHFCPDWDGMAVCLDSSEAEGCDCGRLDEAREVERILTMSDAEMLALAEPLDVERAMAAFAAAKAAIAKRPDEEPQRSEGDTALQQAQQKSDTNNTVEDPESDSVEFEKLMP